MADPKKQAARLGAEAMIDAGKDAARKLYEDLTLSDEEKAQREAERAKASKRRKWKWIGIGVGALLAFLLVLTLLAKVGPYLLGFAVLAILGFMGWRWVRRSLGARSEGDAEAAVTAEKRPEKKADPPRERVRVRVEDGAETIAARAAAAAAKSADRERQIDDELAALKRKARE